MHDLIRIFLTGIGATALVDLWSVIRQRIFGVALPNYAYVGRWLGHMPRGRLRHDSIAKSTTVRGEHALGWTAHYLIGVAFALLLSLIRGVAWFREPTLMPALVVGVCTVLAPFLLMQPGMGAGVAASRTPRPGAARLQSLITHGIFGLGLYGAALATSKLLQGD